MALRDLFRRGRAASGAGRPAADEAAARRRPEPELADLRAMLVARPNQAAARLLLADRLARQGEIENAIIEYFAVVESYVENDLHAKAVRLLERVSELAPGRADVEERMLELSGVAATLPRRDLHIARLAQRSTSTLVPASINAAELRRFWNEFGASPLVAELDDGALGLLLAACEVQRISRMTVIVRAGQWQPRCYFIAEGAIEARAQSPDGPPISLLRFTAGELIGDHALLEDAPWLAEHRTTEEQDTTVLRLTRRRLAELARDEGQLDPLFGALRRHGRDREVAAVLRQARG